MKPAVVQQQNAATKAQQNSGKLRKSNSRSICTSEDAASGGTVASFDTGGGTC